MIQLVKCCLDKEIRQMNSVPLHNCQIYDLRPETSNNR